MKYRREIDGLRAIAVIPVVLFHANFPLFSGGFVGVDIFFVISGYLITSIILEEIEKGSFSIIHFYERRARRILPALFFVILISLPFAYFIQTPSELESYSQSLFSVTVFSSNIYFWLTSGYFSSASELKPLLHTWSLAVEEQFYIFFPIYLLLVWRFRKRWVLVSIIALGVISLTLAQLASKTMPDTAFYLLPTRAWELMIGASLAIMLLHREAHKLIAENRRLTNELLSCLGLVMICTSIIIYDKNTPFPSVYTLVPTIGTALLIVFSNSNTLIGHFLGCRLLVGIGLISYSAYLWHQPIFAFTRAYTNSFPSLLFMLFLSSFSFLLAYISWRYIEKPFRTKGQFPRRAIFQFSIIVSSLFASIGLLGHFTNGFLEAKTTAVEKQLLSTATTSPMRDECHTGGADYKKPTDACKYFGPNKRWAIFGDSHAVELAYSLARKLEGTGSGIKHYSFSACPPMYLRSSEVSSCAAWTNEVMGVMSKDLSVEYIVVSYRLNRWLYGEHKNIYPNLPDLVSVEEQGNRWRSYVDVLEHLVSSGKKVILVLQSPELPESIENLILSKNYSDGLIIGVKRKWWDQRSNYSKNRLNEIPKEVHVFDPTNVFCDLENCYGTKDGMALYFDAHHMSVAGANILVDEIFSTLPIIGYK
jgi:peptidoglycan/LPS O-acetylase OafA/YrhL